MYDLAGERHSFISFEEGKEPKTVLDVSYNRFHLSRRGKADSSRSEQVWDYGLSLKLFSGEELNSLDSISYLVRSTSGL
jgi:hypothetical protein